MSQTLTNFDMVALLDSDEAISEYLSQVLADGDSEEFLRAIGYVLRSESPSRPLRLHFKVVSCEAYRNSSCRPISALIDDQ